MSLKSLELRNIGFEKFKSMKGVRQLRLRNLQILDLSNNYFDNNILGVLNGLTSLKSLKLSSNELKGSIYIQGVLLNLEELDVSINTIKELVTLRGDNSTMSKLKVLYLENVDADKNILLQSLDSTFPLLRTLHLDTNIFNETNYTFKLDNLTDLEELYLDGSTIDTRIFRSMGALSSLKILTFTNSMLLGPLNVHDLPHFKQLEVLNISRTTLNNSFLRAIGEMDGLKVLRLGFSGLDGSLSSAPGLCKLRYLRKLDLSNNGFVGNLPACLANLTFIQTLDLSQNQFTGNITESPLTSLKSLQGLSLSDNNFQIPISLGPFYNHSELKILIGDSNVIYADDVPQSLAPKFQLNGVSLSCCGVVGAIPQFLYHQHDLQDVVLSHIGLSGNFPNWLLDNNSRLLELYLVNNSLSGLLDVPVRSHMHFKKLDISHNLFYGEIPTDFGEYFPKLSYLNMGSNRFTNIPSSFGYMSSLYSLNLSNNQLIGKLPEHFGEGLLLSELVLSNNSLQGQIFSEDFNLRYLMVLRLDRNHFTGKIPDSLSNSSILSVLDISNNYFSGSIPKQIGDLSQLTEIRMENNHLECEIPSDLCGLTRLKTLNVSGNNIFGSLPSCFAPSVFEVSLSRNRFNGTLDVIFSNNSSISILDLGNNHLTGSIPHEIKGFSRLVFLFLSGNLLEGEIPIELCKLKYLSWLDLSHNDFSGTIPRCLRTRMVEETIFNYDTYEEFSVSMDIDYSITDEPLVLNIKWMSYLYHGEALKSMCGIDLSCNNFSGKIPPEIGNISNIFALNLSHNSLVGPIPKTFGNLEQIESLDLSNNLLTGNIPRELFALYALGVFSVANNNLSGEVPTSGQTYPDSSYEGNPHLCGLQLRKNCGDDGSSGSTTPSGLFDNEENAGFMDMTAFYASLASTFLVVILGLSTVLLVNPYWRQWWFYHVEKWAFTCYYFVLDNLPKRRRFM